MRATDGRNGHCPPRGDPGRRRHWLPAHPAAVGHRASRNAQGRWRARAPRTRRRRREPAGSPAGALRLCLQRARAASTTYGTAVGSSFSRASSTHSPGAAFSPSAPEWWARSRARDPMWTSPTSSSTSCRSAPTGRARDCTSSPASRHGVPVASGEPRDALRSAMRTRPHTPKIVSNYLAAETDRRVLLDGMKLVRRTTASRRSPNSWCGNTCRDLKRPATRR